MKKIIVNLFLLCFVLSAFSQSVMPTDGDYSNWNWEYQGQENWKRKNGNNWEEIPPPFDANTNRSYDISKVYENEDYTQNKGWSLIFANFNSVYPYFILYNSHLSIVRAFFYLEFNETFTHILATLEFDVNNTNSPPGILTFGRGNHGLAADKYFTTNMGNNDMISVIFPLAPQSWASVDFPITFDPYIQNNRYNSKKWVFSFWGCNNNTLHLQGESASGSSLQIAQNTLISQKSDITYNSATNNTVYSGQEAKFNKKVDSFNSLITQLKATTSTISSADSIVVNGTKQRNVLQSYKKEVESIANMSGYGKIILGLVNFFSGVFDENKPSSASTIQVFKLDGTMTLQQLLRTNTLKIPGVNGNYFPYVDWEPFNCVMGTINLKTSPTIKMTTPYEKYKFYDSYTMWKLIDNPYGEYFGKFVQCRFDSLFTNSYFAINDIDGLNLLDIKCALLFRLTGPSNTILDVTKQFIKHRMVFTNGQSVAINVENPVYVSLDEGLFKIYKYEKENNNVDIIIGTPALPINKLSGLSMEVPEKADVFLRVMATFQSDKYDENIIFQRDYSMDTIRVNANYSKFYGGEQTNFPYSDYYQGTPQIVLKSTTNTSYSAGRIILKPGFKGQARTVTKLGHTIYTGFKATAIDIYPTFENTLFNHYNFDCDYIPPQQNAPSKNIGNAIIDNNTEVQIYPNPSNGLFYISSINNIESVKIFDVLGKIIYQQKNIRNNLVEIKLISNFVSGIYLIQAELSNKELMTKKIVINY